MLREKGVLVVFCGLIWFRIMFRACSVIWLMLRSWFRASSNRCGLIVIPTVFLACFLWEMTRVKVFGVLE